jgi:hypothetical protein
MSPELRTLKNQATATAAQELNAYILARSHFFVQLKYNYNHHTILHVEQLEG